MVPGGIHPCHAGARPSDAADTALDGARLRGRLPAGAASKRQPVARVSDSDTRGGPAYRFAHAGYEKSLHRFAVLIDASTRIAKCPLLDDLPAFLQLGGFGWGARRRCSRTLDHRPAG